MAVNLGVLIQHFINSGKDLTPQFPLTTFDLFARPFPLTVWSLACLFQLHCWAIPPDCTVSCRRVCVPQVLIALAGQGAVNTQQNTLCKSCSLLLSRPCLSFAARSPRSLVDKSAAVSQEQRLKAIGLWQSAGRCLETILVAAKPNTSRMQVEDEDATSKPVLRQGNNFSGKQRSDLNQSGIQWHEYL